MNLIANVLAITGVVFFFHSVSFRTVAFHFTPPTTAAPLSFPYLLTFRLVFLLLSACSPGAELNFPKLPAEAQILNKLSPVCWGRRESIVIIINLICIDLSRFIETFNYIMQWLSLLNLHHLPIPLRMSAIQCCREFSSSPRAKAN